MAAAKTTASRAYLGLGVAALSCILLGWRVEGSVREVLGTARHARVAADPQAQEERALLGRVARQDSLVLGAACGERDPFRDPSVWTGNPSSTPSHPPVEPRAVPALGALLYTSINPSVMLRIGPESSDWLHRGESFRGWRVVEINTNSVTITKDSETVVLHSS
jgi:hypothetical protein